VARLLETALRKRCCVFHVSRRAAGTDFRIIAGMNPCLPRHWFGFLVGLLLLVSANAARSADVWVAPGADGQPQIQLYFFWSLTCPHCVTAHPHVADIPLARPWVRVHELELSRNAANVDRFTALAHAAVGEAVQPPHRGPARSSSASRFPSPVTSIRPAFRCRR